MQLAPAREMQTLASESGDSKNELMIVINDHAQLKTKKVIAIASRARETCAHGRFSNIKSALSVPLSYRLILSFVYLALLFFRVVVSLS